MGIVDEFSLAAEVA